MTYGEIKSEILALGFSDTELSDTAVALAVKRALGTAYTERGVISSAKLLIPRERRRELFFSLTHEGGGKETFPLYGKAYSMILSGKGEYKIKDERGERRESFSSEKGTVKGFIHGVGEITFLGEFCYTVYRLSTFDTKKSDRLEDIPSPSPVRVIDLPDQGIRLLGAASDIRDECGRRVDGAIAVGERLYLPESFSGELTISYRAAPPDLPPDDKSRDVDIPEELAPLIPLLAASYVWLDDDPDKAQYYAARYREGMSALKLYSERRSPEAPTDVTGWAR